MYYKSDPIYFIMHSHIHLWLFQCRGGSFLTCLWESIQISAKHAARICGLYCLDSRKYAGKNGFSDSHQISRPAINHLGTDQTLFYGRLCCVLCSVYHNPDPILGNWLFVHTWTNFIHRTADDFTYLFKLINHNCHNYSPILWFIIWLIISRSSHVVRGACVYAQQHTC